MFTKRSVAVWSVAGALGLVLATGVPGLAQERWVTHGPYGGSTAVLLPSASEAGGVYAGVLGYGVYFRPANARAWVERSDGLDNRYVMSLAQNPENPLILYAGTMDNVYWTTDGGVNWEPRNGGLSVADVRAIAVSRSQPNVLYAGGVWSGYWRVYKSVNSGLTWADTGTGLPAGADISAIVVDPTNSDIVYVGTEANSGGVYKSVNGGGQWVESSTGLLNSHVLCLTMDPASRATLYAGVYGSEYWANGGVYVSYDSGANWTQISGGLPTAVELRINSIAVAYDDFVDRPILYAAGAYGYSLPQPPGTWTQRLYKSTNMGGSWEALVNGSTYPDWMSVAVDPRDQETVYAGSECGGVFRSTNSGGNWAHWSTGLAPLGVHALTVHPSDPNMVFAGTVTFLNEFSPADAGVFVSFDGGNNWWPRPQNMRIGDSFYTASLAIAEGEVQDTIYAANRGWMMYLSRDLGQTWEWRGWGSGIDGYWLQTVVVDPVNQAIAYVSGAGFEPSLPDIYKTYNFGETWTPVATYLVWAEFMGLAINPQDPNEIYAGSAWEGVWKTTDAGANWDLTGLEIMDAKVKSLVVNPEHPRNVFAADNQWDSLGAFVSVDSGGHWWEFNQGLGVLDVEALAIDSPVGGATDYPTKLYAGTEGGGVFRRVEGGVWYAVNEGLDTRNVFSLAIAPHSPDTAGRAVYAGTARGAYRRVVFDDDGIGDFEDSAGQ